MIGRILEKEILEECLNSERPEFLALYGRRRVGKTYLIKEFFNNTFSFYATGVKNVSNRQKLKIFKESLVRYGDTDKTIPSDWLDAFSRLRKLLESDSVYNEYRSRKKIVFLDELPWMDGPRSDFKSALDYFWNSWGSSQKDLLLIVCGSATSWIINNIVKDTGGFYNRLTRQMCLLPFNLRECEMLLEANGVKMTRRQVIECYMIMGGIPYYLNYIKPRLSLAQNIEMLFFGPSAPLKQEFDLLFSSLFQKSEKYIDVIKEISKNKSGCTRNELIDSGNTVSGKDLTKCLEELEQCGFIRKYQSFGKNKNGYIYQLIDSLTSFYFTFLKNDKIDSWIGFINTPAYYNWCGHAFERVCLLHTKQIKRKLGISGVASKEFSWRSKNTEPGVQIDLLIDRKDDVINVCEEKYSVEEYVIDSGYEKELLHKVETFRNETKTQKALHLTMISFSGIKKNAYSNTVVCSIDGDDLFE